MHYHSVIYPSHGWFSLGVIHMSKKITSSQKRRSSQKSAANSSHKPLQNFHPLISMSSEKSSGALCVPRETPARRNNPTQLPVQKNSFNRKRRKSSFLFDSPETKVFKLSRKTEFLRIMDLDGQFLDHTLKELIARQLMPDFKLLQLFKLNSFIDENIPPNISKKHALHLFKRNTVAHKLRLLLIKESPSKLKQLDHLLSLLHYSRILNSQSEYSYLKLECAEKLLQLSSRTEEQILKELCSAPTNELTLGEIYVKNLFKRRAH